MASCVSFPHSASSDGCVFGVSALSRAGVFLGAVFGDALPGAGRGHVVVGSDSRAGYGGGGVVLEVVRSVLGRALEEVSEEGESLGRFDF